MTYTRVMYDMPPNKVGDKGKDDFWKLPYKPAGAMAASCVVNKCWQDIHAFHEEMFNTFVLIIDMQMLEVSLLIHSRFADLKLERLTDLVSFSQTQNPPYKSGPLARWFLRKLGLHFIIARQDMTAKDHAHEAYPNYEEISDEEWTRRATPLHYPYHTIASQRAYDKEMVIRARNRAERQKEDWAMYAARRDGKLTENGSIVSSDSGSSDTVSSNSDAGSFYSGNSSDDSYFVDFTSVNFSSVSTDDLIMHFEDVCKRNIAWEDAGNDLDDPEYQRNNKLVSRLEAIIRARWAVEDAEIAAKQEAAIANQSHFSDDADSDIDSVDAVEYEPNWDIKLHYYANPNTGFLDFDNDPFLCSEDEEHINDVQYCFVMRNFRMLKEVNARLIHPNIEKGGREHERLKKLSQKLVDAVHDGIEEIRFANAEAEQSEEDEDTQDEDGAENNESKDVSSGGDGSGGDDNSDPPEWLRTISKVPRLIIEAPDMDTNPLRVGLVPMTIEEEEQYLGEVQMRRLVEVACHEHDQEDQRRMPEEIQEQGRGIQWLHTRDREDFPTSPRVSPSAQRVTPTAAAQDNMVSPARQPSGKRPVMRRPSFLVQTFDGENLKCFSVGPHHSRDYESSTSSKKKSRVGRALKKVEKKIEKKLERFFK
jgi:hypothetical protein